MKKRINHFTKILQDIKDVEIQGATNIAKAGVKAFLLQSDKKSIKKILNTRPTEPLMQNAIRFLKKSKNPKTSSIKFFNYLKNSNQKIAKFGAGLIKKEMNIYVHCHSSSVIEILKQAKKRKKTFVVYTTEVEPLLQGRQTAEDLAKSKIQIVVAPDLAAEQTLKKCDLLLFGADAFTKKGLANKIGTSMLCKLAEEFNIPRYSAGVSLKFTKKIKLESRPSHEVWKTKNKKIKIINPAFDFVDKKLLTGVISEFGILSYKQFIKKAKQNLKKFS
jgi:translation initiation factor 2B subunit (eIF-2B alpha/beta/delta family)